MYLPSQPNLIGYEPCALGGENTSFQHRFWGFSRRSFDWHRRWTPIPICSRVRPPYLAIYCSNRSTVVTVGKRARFLAVSQLDGTISASAQPPHSKLRSSTQNTSYWHLQHTLLKRSTYRPPQLVLGKRTTVFSFPNSRRPQLQRFVSYLRKHRPTHSTHTFQTLLVVPECSPSCIVVPSSQITQEHVLSHRTARGPPTSHASASLSENISLHHSTTPYPPISWCGPSLVAPIALGSLFTPLERIPRLKIASFRFCKAGLTFLLLVVTVCCSCAH